MADIERLISQFEREACRKRMETMEDLCDEYCDCDQATRKLWVASFLKCQEERIYGSLLSENNAALLYFFEKLIESLNVLDISENSSIIHNSIDLILTRELTDMNSLEKIKTLLSLINAYDRSDQIYYQYIPLAINRISELTLEILMNPNKTIEDIQKFLVIYLQLVVLIDLSELSWSVIFNICEFIRKELIINNKRDIASECFFVLYTIREFCENQNEISEINSMICRIEQLFQIRATNAISPAVPPDIPPDLKRLNLDQITNSHTIYINQRSEFITVQVDRVFINNSNMILKIYEIPVSKRQDLERIYKEARVYQKMSSSNSKYFLKYYGIHSARTKKFETDTSMIKLTLGIENCSKSLENLIKRNITEKIVFTTQEIAKIAYELISGLLTMRNLGVIHQDIKPENIMIGDDDCMKIIDFDVSYVKISGVTFTGKMISLVVGTQGYYSPEKLKCHLNRNRNATQISYDPEYSDIFSLGLILYQMITLTENILYQNASDLHNHIDQFLEIDQNIRALVKTMLAQNPNDRVNFATALTMVPYKENNGTSAIP